MQHLPSWIPALFVVVFVALLWYKKHAVHDHRYYRTRGQYEWRGPGDFVLDPEDSFDGSEVTGQQSATLPNKDKVSFKFTLTPLSNCACAVSKQKELEMIQQFLLGFAASYNSPDATTKDIIFSVTEAAKLHATLDGFKLELISSVSSGSQ